jgi:hypothetical protein
MKEMSVKDVVNKIIGEIDPVGEHNEDEKRFENLKEMCELVNELITQIDDVAMLNDGRIEYSRNKAGKFASDFLSSTLGIVE